MISGATAVSTVRILHYPSAHEAAGALGTRHSRAPSFSGAVSFAQLGRSRAARTRKSCLTVIASAAKQSSFACRGQSWIALSLRSSQ